MADAEIREFIPEDFDRFRELFGLYLEREFGMDLPEPKLGGFCREIAQLADDGVVYLDILVAGDIPEGFVLYQIDSPRSDWCEKAGLGFIRELYVAEHLRGRGYGKRLAERAEEALFARGVQEVYLTSEKSGAFWEKRGYINTGETSVRNHDPIFIKVRHSACATSCSATSMRKPTATRS